MDKVNHHQITEERRHNQMQTGQNLELQKSEDNNTNKATRCVSSPSSYSIFSPCKMMAYSISEKYIDSNK